MRLKHRPSCRVTVRKPSLITKEGRHVLWRPFCCSQTLSNPHEGVNYLDYIDKNKTTQFSVRISLFDFLRQCSHFPTVGKVVVMKPALILTVITAFAAPAFAEAEFRTLDLDGDRFLTFDELTRTVSGVTRSNFRNADINRDRRLSATEFLGLQPHALVARESRADGRTNAESMTLPAADFDLIDADGNGLITFEELIRIDAPSILSVRDQ